MEKKQKPLNPGKIRVLIIEDDEDDYQILLSMFSETRGPKYEVRWIADWDAGLKELCRGKYEVCLLDYRLGSFNGLELLRIAIDRGCKMPVVFLTAYGDYELDIRAMRAGASDYLVKGEFTPPLLERTIRYAIEQRGIEEELRRHREHLEKLVQERTIQHAEARADAEKRAAEAEEKRATLEALLDHVPAGIIIADAPGLRIRAISKYSQKLGIHTETFSEGDASFARPTWNASRAGDNKAGGREQMPLFRAAFKGEEIHNEEWELPEGEADETVVLCSAGPIRDTEDSITGGIMVCRDISELKAIQEQLRKARDELEERVADRTRELESTLASLDESRRQLRHLAQALLKVQEEERRKISREIHDSVGSSLSAVKFCVENALQQMKKGTATPDMLEHLSAILEQSIEETRRIMTDLRPSILDDFGLVVTIDWLTRRHRKLYENTVIFKKIEIDESDIPEPLKITIFRVLQEALTNIAKHSGASMVDIHLEMTNGLIELKVEDNGVGFDPESHPRYAASGGLGLAGMKERTELSGGSFSVDSEPGAGTKVHASWPAELEQKRRRASPAS